MDPTKKLEINGDNESSISNEISLLEQSYETGNQIDNKKSDMTNDPVLNTQTFAVENKNNGDGEQEQNGKPPPPVIHSKIDAMQAYYH